MWGLGLKLARERKDPELGSCGHRYEISRFMEAGYMDTMRATASLSKYVFRRANSGHLNSHLYYVS